MFKNDKDVFIWKFDYFKGLLHFCDFWQFRFRNFDDFVNVSIKMYP